MAEGGGFCQASCCETCGNLSFSSEWYQAFGVVLCNYCKRDEALISKGHAMTQYCLTARDLKGLGCISKDNPQKKNWSAMKLYMRRQVEELAIKKHGDLESVRQLRHDRTQAKVQGWLAKRARAGAADEDEEDDEEGGDGDGGEEEGGTERKGGGAAATRVKLSAAAARVRARLASEYEAGAAASGGTKKCAGQGGRGGGGSGNVAPAEEPGGSGGVGADDVEVF